MTRDARPAGDLGRRQERFVEEYIVDVNAKQAAIRAGYSAKTAEAQGSRLLSNVKVQRAIAARMAARSKRTEVTADRVLLEIARLGFSDLRRLFHQDGRLKHPLEWDDDTAASVASVEVVTRDLGDGKVEHVRKIKLWDKGKALHQLASHLGLHRDQDPSPDERLSDMTDQELARHVIATMTSLGISIPPEL